MSKVHPKKSQKADRKGGDAYGQHDRKMFVFLCLPQVSGQSAKCFFNIIEQVWILSDPLIAHMLPSAKKLDPAEKVYLKFSSSTDLYIPTFE